VIRRAVAGAIIEITGGCGRGCQFCSPDLLAFRSIPKDRILQEVEVLVRNGRRGICLLHSEEPLFYGRAGWEALT
jgi:radical SAM superfamily enzyme YgiQ (UPF0313 family)